MWQMVLSLDYETKHFSAIDYGPGVVAGRGGASRGAEQVFYQLGSGCC